MFGQPALKHSDVAERVDFHEEHGFFDFASETGDIGLSEGSAFEIIFILGVCSERIHKEHVLFAT